MAELARVPVEMHGWLIIEWLRIRKRPASPALIVNGMEFSEWEDTVAERPGVDVDLIADNSGKWMVHCHNACHAEAGMMARLDYVT